MLNILSNMETIELLNLFFKSVEIANGSYHLQEIAKVIKGEFDQKNMINIKYILMMIINNYDEYQEIIKNINKLAYEKKYQECKPLFLRLNELEEIIGIFTGLETYIETCEFMDQIN